MSTEFQSKLQQQILEKRLKEQQQQQQQEGGSKHDRNASTKANCVRQSNSDQPLGNKKNVHFQEQAKQKVMEEMAKAQNTRFIRPSSQQQHDGPEYTEASFPHTTLNDDLQVGQDQNIFPDQFYHQHVQQRSNSNEALSYNNQALMQLDGNFAEDSRSQNFYPKGNTMNENLPQKVFDGASQTISDTRREAQFTSMRIPYEGPLLSGADPASAFDLRVGGMISPTSGIVRVNDQSHPPMMADIDHRNGGQNMRYGQTQQLTTTRSDNLVNVGGRSALDQGGVRSPQNLSQINSPSWQEPLQLDDQDALKGLSPKQALIRPREEMGDLEALVDDEGDDQNHNQSNAYEVALVDNRISQDGSYFFIEDGNLDNLTIDEPEPLVIRIDLGGGNFASVTAHKYSDPHQLAEKLCQEYGLPEAIMEPLSNRIQLNMESHFRNSQDRSMNFNQLQESSQQQQQQQQQDLQSKNDKKTRKFIKSAGKKKKKGVISPQNRRSYGNSRVVSPVRSDDEIPMQGQKATTYNLKASPVKKAGNEAIRNLSRPKSSQPSSNQVTFVSPKQDCNKAQMLQDEKPECDAMTEPRSAVKNRRHSYFQDFQAASMHRGLLSPGASSKPKLSFNMRKAPQLPSDHPQLQGMRETPTINQKSVKILEKRFQGNQEEYDPKVHTRLYSQTLLKDELAKKTEMEVIEEATRKQEYMLREFQEHRHSVSQGLNPGNRIYTRGIKMIENKERLVIQAKVFKDHMEVKSCSFKPKFFTKKSTWNKKEEKKRAQSSLQGMVQPTRFEELYKKQAEKQHKLQQKRSESSCAELSGVNFKPEINQRSRDIYQARLDLYTWHKKAALQRRGNESQDVSTSQNNNSTGARSVSFMEDKKEGKRQSQIQVRASQTWSSLRNMKNDLREADQEVGGSTKEKSQERQGVPREGPDRGLGADYESDLDEPPTQYELLYQDAMARVQRHKRIQNAFISKDCTFEPKINNFDTTVSLSSQNFLNMAQRAAASKAASKRLYKQAQAQQARMQEIERKRDKGDFNPECTFEPQLKGKQQFYRENSSGRRSGLSKGRAKSDIGMTRSNLLYENYNRIQDRKEKLKEDEEIRHKYESRDPKRKNQKSEMLIQQRKEMNLELIFDQLDGDRDNCISIDAINIEAVPRDVSHVLMPIISELEELDEGQGAIDRQEFVQACLRLYQTLNVADRNVILSYGKASRPAFQENHSHTPYISKKSKEIASAAHQGISPVQPSNHTMTFGMRTVAMLGKGKPLNFYERQVYHQQKKELKIKEQQDMLKDQELDGCTFHPILRTEVLPGASYVLGEEKHHHLQSYLEGQSYGGQSDEGEALRNAAEAVNYVNNL